MSTLQSRTRLTGFVHHLRAQGFVLGVRETLDALRNLCEFDSLDERQARHTLKALACQQSEDWHRFDDLFQQYFYPERVEPELSPAEHIAPRLRRRGVVGLASTTDDELHSARLWGSGAGRQMTITRADYRFLNDRKAMQEAERLAERLALTLCERPKRKRVVSPTGRHLDIRRTLRSNLATGGMPVKRVFTDRQIEPTRLVILHDISHSMTWHNPLLYRFVRGLVRSFRTSEAFAFHTRLFRVSDLYREPSVVVLRKKLEARENLWMGGTCIAESIGHFIDKWSPTLSHHNTLVMILSDGFDTDEPEDLADKLRELARRYRKTIWLNPMLGREGYTLDGASMQAAVPHLDLLAPAHSVEALGEAVVYIRETIRSTSAHTMIRR